MAQIVLLCVGGAVTSIGSAVLWRLVRLPLFGQRATGALAGWRHTFEQKWRRSGHVVRTTYYYPVVRFETADGAPRQAIGRVGYESKPDWPTGRPFAVRYDAADPADASVDLLTSLWVFPAVFLMAGIEVVLAGAT